MLYQLSYSRSRGPTAFIEAAGLWGVKQADDGARAGAAGWLACGRARRGDASERMSGADSPILRPRPPGPYLDRVLGAIG